MHLKRISNLSTESPLINKHSIWIKSRKSEDGKKGKFQVQKISQVTIETERLLYRQELVNMPWTLVFVFTLPDIAWRKRSASDRYLLTITGFILLRKGRQSMLDIDTIENYAVKIYAHLTKCCWYVDRIDSS